MKKDSIVKIKRGKWKGVKCRVVKDPYKDHVCIEKIGGDSPFVSGYFNKKDLEDV